ncbi:MAG: hypothetical protein OXG35_21955 [Acidobacteria bacterium]|nr:hypothetical protein [Acidobacteriota bacterium]
MVNHFYVRGLRSPACPGAHAPNDQPMNDYACHEGNYGLAQHPRRGRVESRLGPATRVSAVFT